MSINQNLTLTDEFVKRSKFECFSVAEKISSDYGLKRLSIGDALRYVLNHQPDTELALMLNWHLHKGMTAPDELAVQALELSLMESISNTAG